MEIENDIYVLSKAFALRIIHLYRYLTNEKRENVISKQLLRSGTSIGANVHEAKNAQSRADFSSKMNIALKEATFISKEAYESLYADCSRVKAVLVKIVKATKIPKE